MDWEEKGAGGNRGDLREETESQKWERVINTLLSKNGTEHWILKCPKFISNTEKQRLKSRVEVRLLKIQ